MRITFVTGSLEPGKDGVGDYTRGLCLEASARNVACQAVALADPFVERRTEATENGTPILRLPQSANWNVRMRDLDEAVVEFMADWVSLQFVPYSFQSRGIPLRFTALMTRRRRPPRLHVMFHETWVERDCAAGVIRWLQRSCTRRLGRAADAAHTSNWVYAAALDGEGIPASVLPMFGAIPVVSGDGMSWMQPFLEAEGCDAADRRDRWWLAGVFGALHPVWPAEPLLARLEKAAVMAGKRLAVISAGRLPSGEETWNSLRARYGARVPCIRLGELAASRVSQFLSTIDFGLATTPIGLLRKSATVAAMLEHGLPVIVNRSDGPPEHPGDHLDDQMVIRLSDGFEAHVAAARRGPPRSRRTEAVGRLLASLAAASR